MDIENAKLLASTIELFPNPNTGQFTINTDENFDGQMRVLNASGSTVHQEKINNLSGNHDINLEYLPDGLYILQLTDDKTNKKTISKFIIQK